MPTTETPTKANEPNEPLRTGLDPTGAEAESSQTEEEQQRAPRTRSRWVDYDTHELMEMISELEDERRWARLREGILWALLFHILLLSAVTWIPKYVLRVPPVVDPFDAIKQRKDLSYLDLPPDLLKKLQPKVDVKPVPEKQPRIDRKTLEDLRKAAPPTPAPEQTKPPEIENPVQPQPQPATPPSPKSQSPVEAPKPLAVPAKPNFAMGSQNPADRLRDAMRASKNSGFSAGTPAPAGGGLSMHPGAGSGGVEVLSDTQGVDFNSWLIRWHRETERTWDPLIPDEVNPPILKSGAVVIRFKVLPNGRIMDGSMILEGRSGDTGLDRAAWGALTGSNYPPLPREFHGPYLELRAMFLYNMQPH